MLVHAVKIKGDKWLVDAGSFHTFSPIDMTFDLESMEYQESYATYNYVKKGDTYICLQQVSDGIHMPVVKDGWAYAYYFDLNPISREFSLQWNTGLELVSYSANHSGKTIL